LTDEINRLKTEISRIDNLYEVMRRVIEIKYGTELLQTGLNGV
jgi:hypothetical protein